VEQFDQYFADTPQDTRYRTILSWCAPAKSTHKSHSSPHLHGGAAGPRWRWMTEAAVTVSAHGFPTVLYFRTPNSDGTE